MRQLKKKPKLGFWGVTAAECLLGAVAMLLLHQLAPSNNPDIQMIKIKVMVFFLVGMAICLLILLVLATLWAVSKPKDQHREG
ncbi:hypothetical protein [Saezia sanguinis]|uniref:hypothetical protein n=1 Tax=Saezia sanguinis TaxID=1965230 RepID=UPI00302085FA